jgi:hypothetical protein
MQALGRKAEFTPEPQQPPAEFQNLALRAQAAGYAPGSAQYRQFMASGGIQAKPQQTARTVTGGTPEARRIEQQDGVTIPEGETYEIQYEGENVVDVNRLGTGVEVSGDRSQEVKTTKALEDQQLIQDRNVALAGVVRSANDILTLARQSKGTSLGVVGDIVRVGQGLTAQAQTAASAMGFSLDPSQYDFGAFPDAASKEAAQRTETLALAYSILRAREPEARQFSNADIQNTLNTIGGNSSSYQQLYSQLSQVVRGSLSSATESYQSQVRGFEGTGIQPPPSPIDYLNTLESPIAGVSYDVPLFTQYGNLDERRAAESFLEEAIQEGSLDPNTTLGNFDSNTNSFEVLDDKGNVIQELQMERDQ